MQIFICLFLHFSAVPPKSPIAWPWALTLKRKKKKKNLMIDRITLKKKLLTWKLNPISSSKVKIKNTSCRQTYLSLTSCCCRRSLHAATSRHFQQSARQRPLSLLLSYRNAAQLLQLPSRRCRGSSLVVVIKRKLLLSFCISYY